MSLHESALFFAKEILRFEAQLLETLTQMEAKKIFASLGYKGIFDYVLNALKLSEAQAYYYKRVIQKSAEVPRLSEAVLNGELSLSKARRISSVVTPESCEDWIKKSNELKQRDLEAEVAKINPKAKVREGTKPVGPKLIQLTVALTPEVEALLKRVKDLESQRTKTDACWNEVLQHSCEAYLDKHDPVRRAERLTWRKSRTSSPPKRGRHPISAHVKHQVNLRDRGQCVERNPDGTRCSDRRWLEFDHVIKVEDGGLNTVENLRTLCGFHHRRRHAAEQSAMG